jgi:hypothetical protein
MIVESHLKELCDRFKYPDAIMEFDFEAKNHTRFCIENAIWDIATGVILKIDENKRILSAIRGFEILTMSQIQEIFGEEAEYPHLDWPARDRKIYLEKGSHWVLSTIFETSLIPVIC